MKPRYPSNNPIACLLDITYVTGHNSTNKRHCSNVRHTRMYLSRVKTLFGTEISVTLDCCGTGSWTGLMLQTLFNWQVNLNTSTRTLPKRWKWTECNHEYLSYFYSMLCSNTLMESVIIMIIVQVMPQTSLHVWSWTQWQVNIYGTQSRFICP